MNTDIWLLPAALMVFGGVTQFAHWYGRNWQPPAGSEQSNWPLRRNISLGLGAVTVLTATVASLIFVPDTLTRILIVGQAILLAAAGASDVRKFHLPLPLTLAGIALAIATLVSLQMPLLIVAFGLIWATALIVLFALATRRAMALGDYIATLWIALAAPFNGVLAVIAGDVANFIYVRVTGQHTNRKAKLAAAGPWLLFAAALIALPPFMTWPTIWPSQFQQTTVAKAMTKAMTMNTSATTEAKVIQTAAPLSVAHTAETHRIKALLWLAQNAGDATAQVAFADDRVGRIEKAQQAAATIAEYEQLAHQFDADPTFTATLHDLQLALATYDIDAVRAASRKLGECQADLTAQLGATSALTDTVAGANTSANTSVITDAITDRRDVQPDSPADTSHSHN